MDLLQRKWLAVSTLAILLVVLTGTATVSSLLASSDDTDSSAPDALFQGKSPQLFNFSKLAQFTSTTAFSRTCLVLRTFCDSVAFVFIQLIFCVWILVRTVRGPPNTLPHLLLQSI